MRSTLITLAIVKQAAARRRKRRKGISPRTKAILAAITGLGAAGYAAHATRSAWLPRARGLVLSSALGSELYRRRAGDKNTPGITGKELSVTTDKDLRRDADVLADAVRPAERGQFIDSYLSARLREASEGPFAAGHVRVKRPGLRDYLTPGPVRRAISGGGIGLRDRLFDYAHGTEVGNSAISRLMYAGRGGLESQLRDTEWGDGPNADALEDLDDNVASWLGRYSDSAGEIEKLPSASMPALPSYIAHGRQIINESKGPIGLRAAAKVDMRKLWDALRGR